MVWPCHEERERVNAQGCDAVKDEGKRRPRLRWLDNIDRHQKGKNTSLKEVLQTKCFENIQDWRTLISRSTDRNSAEDPWAPPWSVVNSEHHSPLMQIMIQCTMLRCKITFYYDAYDTWAGILEPTASSWFLDRGLHLCNRISSTQKFNSCLLHPYSSTIQGHLVWSCGSTSHSVRGVELEEKEKLEKKTKFSWTI